MIRTQVLLDEELYREMKRLAYERNQSLSAVIRDLLWKASSRKRGKRPGKQKLTLEDFTFIGAVKGGKADNISERHDEILGESKW